MDTINKIRNFAKRINIKFTEAKLFIKIIPDRSTSDSNR